MRVPFPFKLKIALLQILHHANYYFGMCSSCSVFFKIPDLRKKGRNKNAILRGNLRHTFSNLSGQIRSPSHQIHYLNIFLIKCVLVQKCESSSDAY